MVDGQMQYRFGSYVIGMARRELLHDGEPVVVQARVFDLLAYLASHSDRVVDKSELQDAVWPGRVITDAAMSRAVMKARLAVGDDANDPAIIKTLYGRGFHFVAPVEIIQTESAASASPSDQKAMVNSTRAIMITAALIAMAFAVFLVGEYRPASPSSERATQSESVEVGTDGVAESGRAEPEYPPNSIAVLPFVNMSDDAANEYFSDGISEELLNLLVKIPELRVTSRTSAFSLKGKDIKAADIARELKVAHLLEGSVRKAGNRVRITAQLIDSRSDTHMWSATYDRTLDDIFAIQDEIAVAVVGALKLTLLGDAPKSESVNAEAYALFLQAKYLNAQGTSETFAQSVELYQQVLDLAPSYARAWRGLAVNYVNQANKGLRPKGESFDLARDAINRALAISPGYARAHAMLGVFSMTLDRDLVAAAPHFVRALALQPNDAVLLSYASSFLLRLGRLDEVIALRERDVVNDPLDPIGYNNLAWAYAMDSRADDAIAATRTLLLLAPRYNGAHYTWSKALLLKGEFPAALDVIQQERSEVWRLIGLGMAHHSLGQAAEADKALGALIREYEQDWAYYIALVLAFRGESDLTFVWLKQAVKNDDTSLTYVAIEPLFANLHDDPRWLSFLESIGMAPAQLNAIEFKVAPPD